MARKPAAGLCIAWYLVLACLILPRAAQADTPRDVLRIGQSATVPVYAEKANLTLDGIEKTKSEGSAFCITRSGCFVTDAHVIGDADWVTITMETRPHCREYFRAHLIKMDKDLDLAVLKVDNLKGLKPLDIATPVAVTKGMHVTAFGFPVKDSLNSRMQMEGDPVFDSASVHRGRVTALYGKGRVLTDVETDTSMSPGASGGPILNDRGQLVGILQRGHKDSTANLSKSFNAILKYLATPEIAAALRKPDLQFSPPEGIPGDEVTQEHPFAAWLFPGLSPLPAVQVSLTLNALGASPRVYHGVRRPDGAYEFHAPPLPPLPSLHTVTLTTPGSAVASGVSFQVKDQPVTIGTRSVQLSDISRIDQGGEPVVTLMSGERIEEPVQGLEAVQTLQNSQVIARDLREVKRITVHDDYETPRTILYHLAVTQATRTLMERSGKFYVDPLPPRQMGQGVLIACGTAWATNNTGSGKGHAADLSPSAARYIRNVTDILTGGAKSNILIMSDHWTFGNPFQEVLRAAGHTVTVSLDPGPLDHYDVVFVGGRQVDQRSLVAFVKQGGKLYLSGGLDAEGEHWDYLLNAFGLYSQKDVHAEALPGSGFVYAPLFEGVTELKRNGAMYLARTPQAKRDAQIIVNQSDANLWAIYRAGEKLAPEPPAVTANQ